MTIDWKVVPFDKVFVDASRGNPKTPQREYLGSGPFPVVDQGKDLIAGYVDDAGRLCKAPLPVIVFGDHTRAIKYVDFPFCMGADGVKVLRPEIEANVKYLYHYLRQLRLTEGGYDRHFKYLKRSHIVLPPLEEQRRIAAILDQAEALRAKRRAAIDRLDSLTQSIFLDMFGDPVTNPKGWPVCSLAKLGDIHTGKTPPTKLEGMFGDDIPFATPSDLDVDLEYTQRSLT
ncbi:MAG: restriction endonuclease subunit S, partial [Chloroflexota bacterium]